MAPNILPSRLKDLEHAVGTDERTIDITIELDGVPWNGEPPAVGYVRGLLLVGIIPR